MRRTVVIGVLVLGMMGLLLWVQSAPAPPARPATPPPGAPPPVTEAAPMEPRRSALPKPTTPRPDRRRVIHAPPVAPAAEGPVDKREGATAGDTTAEHIKEGMELVTDDIRACIDAWSAVDPNIHGRVVVGFRLDAAGLQEAWLVDHEAVPAGPLSCFASAVWEVDWEGVTETEVQVTFPFIVESE